jgi:hypothetical protein
VLPPKYCIGIAIKMSTNKEMPTAKPFNLSRPIELSIKLLIIAILGGENIFFEKYTN